MPKVYPKFWHVPVWAPREIPSSGMDSTIDLEKLVTPVKSSLMMEVICQPRDENIFMYFLERKII